ncbi:hypothetical protein [Streptomyces sp. CC210A]|uniref:hypothetical protein n=1 Tax=Streptomyces sp. CC210A TaxID=2898184 RepID=UPI0027E44383|nr:hypothetical protein [Streptomyces sp. CC210A]
MSEQQTPAPGPDPADRRLDEELRAVRARRGAYVPAAMLEVIDRATADLAASGRAERALAVGRGRRGSRCRPRPAGPSPWTTCSPGGPSSSPSTAARGAPSA